jgi:hypothetical protein
MGGVGLGLGSSTSGELRERQSPALLVVGVGNAGWQPFVEGEHFGAAVGIGERDRHLAAQRRIFRLELDRCDDLLVRTIQVATAFASTNAR